MIMMMPIKMQLLMQKKDNNEKVSVICSLLLYQMHNVYIQLDCEEEHAKMESMYECKSVGQRGSAQRHLQVFTSSFFSSYSLYQRSEKMTSLLLACHFNVAHWHISLISWKVTLAFKTKTSHYKIQVGTLDTVTRKLQQRQLGGTP